MSNLSKIKERNSCLDSVVEETKNRFKSFSNPGNRQYIELLKKLIIQGMTQMLEDECVIRVKESDKSAVSSILEDCENEYTTILKNSTQRDYHCKLSLDDEALDNE